MSKNNFFSKLSNLFSKPSMEKQSNVDIDPKMLPIAYISVEDVGVIEAELYPNIAPNTVNNFISLANDNFYNGLIFHRIVKNFVIQCGCPEGSGMGGPGYTIEGEFNKNKFKTH
ncbi:peptidylprolyl isomerase [Paraclostridium sordellii]|uniref:peptidylprolyl isomerase n=1 Tax=Paraclostridium sordellii TaxID=1505 RepID=UPI0005DED644|nr:peptidylprolyl isomerase [Paeniclostridium sordellii]CEO20675.1 peptidyl-prolyl cis-trans isomerase B [[Clostridium] sordellii] [Paeniclostridium sordellii]